MFLDVDIYSHADIFHRLVVGSWIQTLDTEALVVDDFQVLSRRLCSKLFACIILHDFRLGRQDVIVSFFSCIANRADWINRRIQKI